MKGIFINVVCIMMLLLSCKKKIDHEAIPPTVDSSNEEIQQMVDAINSYDIEEIEGFRTKVKKEHIDILITLWDSEQSWKTKDGFTFLMCDQNDPRLKPMMVEALNSPLIDTRAYGLCYLQGKDCDFDSLMDQSGFLSEKEIDRQINALKI